MLLQLRSLRISFFVLVATAPVFAQTNPTALTLPVSQGWGTTSFTTMPSGFAAWGGLSGGSITSQALAEASVPSSNAGVSSNTPSDGGGGGCYGYAVSSNARFGILTSSNVTSGVCQLAMAINTSGQTNITLTYDLINAVANVRIVGAVCQYRVGITGSWTTLTGTGNPYTQSGGAVGDVTSASLILPPAAENQPIVQIRWAVWRQSGTLGNSSGFAIDNINVTATNNGPLVTGLTLSGGPSYNLGETATATVTLSAAPDSTATVNVSSGAFATTPVTITPPNTSGQAEVSMATAGTYTATATAIANCGGTSTTPSFNVIGTPAPAFNYTGVSTIDDSAANGNGYIEPNESNIHLFFEITNSGTANATGVVGTLTSLSGTATISNGVQNYPDLPIGADGSNALPFNLAVGPGHVCGNVVNLQLAVTSNEGNSTIMLALPTCAPGSDPFAPPADYYLTATGTGATLKTQLHTIISKNYWNGFLSSTTHNGHSYDDAKIALQLTDLDPNNPANLILIYTGISTPKAWDGGSTWNREHQWPDSLGINGRLPAYGDLHHLRPCNPSLNSSRGNSPYGIGGGYFDPDHGSPVRGRSARTIFYMNTRYNGTAPDPSINLVLFSQPVGNQMGDLTQLLQWHYAYPVDATERRRNYVVFSNVANPTYYQGNRNPYIDHPEYVWSIYGTGPNDSQLYVGASPAPDGSSSVAVDLGSVIVTAPMPAAQTVVLSKLGTTPTTFDMTLIGDATSPNAGPRQAFIGGAQSRNVSAGLSSATTSAGLKSGAISVDNTDLTSAGSGQGSADGNDMINISASVLDHANGSFASPSDQNTLTIDFGTVQVGAVLNQNVDIHNLVQTPGFTAALDLDSVNGSGDTGRLTTNIAPFTHLAAGGTQTFTVSFDRSTLGSFSATYTLTNSDEDIPGATAGTNLVLTLTGVVIPSCTMGDMNLDNFVNGDDVQGFVNCLSNINASNCSCGDFTGGGVTAADIPSFVTDLLGS